MTATSLEKISFQPKSRIVAHCIINFALNEHSLFTCIEVEL